jgi:TetR/AcrR family transcriptional regulator, transcriptional repressor of aconitase
VVQVWAQTLRNEEPAAVLREGYDAVRASWSKIDEHAGLSMRDGRAAD